MTPVTDGLSIIGGGNIAAMTSAPEPVVKRSRQLDRSPLEDESEQERWQRNFADLLQELRVAQTGVQILFAFLMTIPFSNRFEQTSAFQRDVYLVALMAAAGATAMIISPVAFHRALFRQGRKPELVRFAHRMATGGLFLMLISMVSAILLITDFILPASIAYLLTAVAGAFFVVFWGVLPFMRRNWGDAEGDEPGTR
jgi:hypothetical protein